MKNTILTFDVNETLLNLDGLKNLKRWMKDMEIRPACIRGVMIPKRETSKKLVRNVKKIIQT